MAIKAQINTGYDPQGNIYQKYRPLDKDSLKVDVNADKDTIQKIATDRINILKKDRRNIYLLKFRAKKIQQIVQTEKAAGRKPPMAIVSSGRSAWIKSMYAKGLSILGSNQRFAGIDDLTPIANGDKIPVYFPYRLTAKDADQRGFYCFVQQNEYQTYTADLKDTGITVIGYELGTEFKPMLGFGASRYAVVNFFMNTGISLAWLIDDNVLYISRLHEFSFFEDKMNSTPGVWALGGTGQAEYQTEKSLRSIRKTENYTPPTNFISPDFLQQAVLWNIKQFVGNTINFSPHFICSGEDVSISYLLGRDKCKAFYECLIYKGCDSAAPQNKQLQKLKNGLYNLIDSVDPIPVNDNSTLKQLLQSNKKYLKGDPVEIARMKASEQIQLKYMSNENDATQYTDLNSKLLYFAFTFNGKYDVQLMNA
ncbi:hypothetical protein SAMN04488128_106401 [Chitinophaga eiseniae]|uniref:Uncharacterized protein n=1 Tax=Chitinophaga eiseniae TaxID=634771 RepID=A0A1T4TVE5_9BACT|nr:hypothetical protein [Chitinophaga eiseniae]SKA44437.1 hypothetical protein SAMN04488128_106401 [Chitinophaga eiseniae]